MPVVELTTLRETPGDAKRLRWLVFPVRLRDLFPHDYVKTSARLVSKHKTCIIIIPVCIHIEGPAEIHSAELIKACYCAEIQSKINAGMF